KPQPPILTTAYNKQETNPYDPCTFPPSSSKKSKPRTSKQSKNVKRSRKSRAVPNPTPPLSRVFFFMQRQQNQRANRAEVAKIQQANHKSQPPPVNFTSSPSPFSDEEIDPYAAYTSALVEFCLKYFQNLWSKLVQQIKI
ncbi:hypothetical protein AABB24_036384, partial [Solanum stoloniferum]